MSLWSVPDLVSCRLMEKFFDYLDKESDTLIALRQAQTYICNLTVGQLEQSTSDIEQKLHEGLLSQNIHYCQDKSNKPYQNPYYWGAWVCQGF